MPLAQTKDVPAMRRLTRTKDASELFAPHLFRRSHRSEEHKHDDDVEARFESEALKHLGGSIAFVSKKRVKWNTKDEE